MVSLIFPRGIEELVEAREEDIPITPALRKIVDVRPPPPPPPSPFDIGRIVPIFFPPAGIVTYAPEGVEEVIKVLPQAIIETVFPPAPLITGQLGIETIQEAEQKRQIVTIPDVFLPPDEKEAVLEELESQRVTVLPDITFPEISIPEMPDILGGLKDVGKYALIAGAVILAAVLFMRK